MINISFQSPEVLWHVSSSNAAFVGQINYKS